MCQIKGKDIKIQRHAPMAGELQQGRQQYLASDPLNVFAQGLLVLVPELVNSCDFIAKNTDWCVLLVMQSNLDNHHPLDVSKRVADSLINLGTLTGPTGCINQQFQRPRNQQRLSSTHFSKILRKSSNQFQSTAQQIMHIQM